MKIIFEQSRRDRETEIKKKCRRKEDFNEDGEKPKYKM